MARRNTVEFSARVPEEEFEFFRKNFPQYGATQWFIETALRTFNARLREKPELRDTVEKGMDRMLDIATTMAQVETANGE